MGVAGKPAKGRRKTPLRVAYPVYLKQKLGRSCRTHDSTPQAHNDFLVDARRLGECLADILPTLFDDSK